MEKSSRFFERGAWTNTLMHAAFILALALSLLAQSAGSGQAQGSGRPVLEIKAPQQVNLGESIDITLTVKQVPDIAGYEAVLLFDTAAAEFGGAETRKNDLKKIGRDVEPLTAVDLPNGVAVGAATCPTDDCVHPKGDKKDKGGSGTIRLSKVNVYPLEAGTFEIRLDAVKFVDASGTPFEVDIPNNTVVVQVQGAEPFHAAPGSMWSLAAAAGQSPGPFDLTGDGQVTHADLMEVAIEWQTTRLAVAPCAPEDPTRDVNHDGCVDVADMQMVAANMGGAPAAFLPGAFQFAAYREPAPRLQGSTFVVNSNGDVGDGNIGNGVCATPYNSCTLRAAIQEANAVAGPNTINFNIPGGGLKNIKLTGKLPVINDASGGVTINGFTQPGASPNSDPLASNAVMNLQIEGNGEGSHDGFTITSPNNAVSGIAIFKVRRSFWIYGTNADNNRLTGVYVGTNAAGTYGAAAAALTAHGIHIESGGSSNRIGGTAVGERNVISGNGAHGLGIWHENSDGNVIYNNIVGLNPRGDARLTNWQQGLDLNYGSSSNILGGTGAGQRNVTSGNTKSGVEVSHTVTTANNQVVGNYIGTDLTGTRATTWSNNSYTGLTIEDGASNNLIANNVISNNTSGGVQITGVLTSGNTIRDNRIGVTLDGTAAGNKLFGLRADGTDNTIGPNNIIAHNRYAGIVIREADKDFNTITRNSTYTNGAAADLGIDLLPANVTLNDAGDGDSGPNENLNFPVLNSATTSTVSGTACGGCVIEVFIADSGSGAYGEGRTFVGSATAAGDGSFSVSVSGVSAGAYVTSTATDSSGNTSEFSLNRVVTP